MADWKIRRTGVCADCEKEFAEGEAHFSALLIAEGTLQRRDHCMRCFEKRAMPEGIEELAFWRTRKPEGKRKGLAVDFDMVEQLFLGLQGREEERLREIGYLLSLLLMRKRRLKLIRVVRNEGEEAMIVRRPRRQEELSVPVFDLSPETAAERKADLAGLFEGASLDDLMAEPPAGTGDEACPEEGATAEDGASAGEGEESAAGVEENDSEASKAAASATQD